MNTDHPSFLCPAAARRPALPLWHHRSRKGAALVIVLGFVVLLTGLVVAFFSRAMTARQVSNANVNQIRTRLFAQGAVDTILGDFKQEIYAGSISSQVVTNGVTTTLYSPKQGDGTTPGSATPSLAIVRPTATLPTDDNFAKSYANLLKRSAYQVPFYSNAAGASTGVYSEVPSPTAHVASNVSTLSVSANGRAITPARWNSHYMLGRDPSKLTVNTGDDNALPYLATATIPTTGPTATVGTWAYAPDWVMVQRKPDTYNVLSSNTLAPLTLKWSAVNDATVIGRYAYMIYNEGGMLDVNAAGYPAATQPDVTSAASKAAPTYKGSPTFADLLALTDPNNKPYLTQAQIDQIAGWRSGATLTAIGSPISGAMPNIVWTAAAKQAFYGLMAMTNAGGYMQASNSKLNSDNLSDHVFTSRQQLIQMFMRGLAAQSPNAASAGKVKAPSATERSNAANVLPYLTTYTRDLNQPSYMPETTRPTVSAQATGGGNDAAGAASNPYSTAVSPINPPFLNTRVGYNTFVRSDFSQGVVGEPLVKKRFQLSRLAWLTYKGPSALRNMPTSDPGDANADADMYHLIDNGISKTFLQQGTAQNIQRYFGLTWSASTNGWTYNPDSHPGKTSAGAIKRLGDIANDATRRDDPDFVELLKAAVNVGAIGKAATNSPTAIRKTNAPGWQDFTKDTNTSFAIIQLFANIIDQFDCDGYPTKITYGGRDFYGVENLPYLYRVQPGILKLREAEPASVPGGELTSVAHSGTTALKDPGVMISLAMPEVWNPHDTNAPMGTPRPTDFGVYGDSYNSVNSSLFYSISNFNAVQSGRDLSTGMVSGSIASTPAAPIPVAPYFSPIYNTTTNVGTFNTSFKRQQLDRPSSLMTFKVPTGATKLFREPTLLARPGRPSGSSLTMPDSTVSSLVGGLLKTVQRDKGQGLAWTGSGFLSESPNPLRMATGEDGYTTVNTKDSDSYIGIFWGVTPVRWVETTGGSDYSAAKPAQIYTAWSTGYAADKGDWCTGFITAYTPDNGSTWVEYDRKDMPVETAWTFAPQSNAQPVNATSGGTYATTQSSLIQLESTPTAFVDPRTSRFGGISGDHVVGPRYAASNGPALNNSVQKGSWVDSANMTRTTDRPDYDAGYGYPARSPDRNGDAWGTQSGLPGWGWHVKGSTSDTGAVSQSNYSWPRPGLFAQNDPNFKNNNVRYSGDPASGAIGSSDPQYYADPDGVVRRGMGAYASSDTIGLPTARATDYQPTNSGGSARESLKQSQSRPWILNRPFRSVAELGYVFSGTPWRNIDFSTPESGYVALLDTFSTTDTSDAQGLIAGPTNINTRQKAVLKAIMSGAYKDDADAAAATPTTLTAAEIKNIVDLLCKNTASADPAKGSYTNISQLVGRFNSKVTITGNTTAPSSPFNIDGSKSYVGFVGDDLTSVLTVNADKKIGRFREAAIRPLVAGANATRTWNVMIDLIAQTGRYPLTAANATKFQVEGEERLWVHVAIDRYTGQVIDIQTEEVQE